MFKAIIFDMDGVLINSEPQQQKEHEDYLKTKGIHLTKEKMNLSVGANAQLRWNSIQDIFKGKMTQKEYYADFTAYRKDVDINYKEILNPGIIDLLSWLNNESYKVALASSSSMNKIQMVLDQCRIGNYFKVLLSGEMFNSSKPNPEIYLTMAKKLNFNPEDCLVVEDSVYGITAAKAAGMYTVALKDSQFGLDQSSADAIISNLLELKKFLIKNVRT